MRIELTVFELPCVSLCYLRAVLFGGLSAYYHIAEEITSKNLPLSKYVRKAWSRNGATAYLYLIEA